MDKTGRSLTVQWLALLPLRIVRDFVFFLSDERVFELQTNSGKLQSPGG